MRTALQEIGISDVLSKNSVLDMAGNGKPELVCSGTDGASVNIGKGWKVSWRKKYLGFFGLGTMGTV